MATGGPTRDSTQGGACNPLEHSRQKTKNITLRTGCHPQVQLIPRRTVANVRPLVVLDRAQKQCAMHGAACSIRAPYQLCLIYTAITGSRCCTIKTPHTCVRGSQVMLERELRISHTANTSPAFSWSGRPSRKTRRCWELSPTRISCWRDPVA